MGEISGTDLLSHVKVFDEKQNPASHPVMLLFIDMQDG